MMHIDSEIQMAMFKTQDDCEISNNTWNACASDILA